MTMLMSATTGSMRLIMNSTRRSSRSRAIPADLKLSSSGSRRMATRAVHRAVHGGAADRWRAGVTDNPGAPDTIGEGGADPRHQRRRPGLRLAGWRITFMVDVTRLPAVPSAMFRRRRWGADRVQPCGCRTTRRWRHMDHVGPLASLKDNTEFRQCLAVSSGTTR